LRHHHPNADIAVAVVVAVVSAATSPSLGNNFPHNDYKVAMRAAISLALQVMGMQQRQWGRWATSAARGGKKNGNNDNYSVTVTALAEYPNL
jgi:hypothetical protein